MHKFIFDKKKRGNIKYTHESKLNNVAVPVPKGTISIMLNTEKKQQNFVLGQKMSETSKYQLKWKTVQWLINNRVEAVNTLITDKQKLWRQFCLLFQDVDLLSSPSDDFIELNLKTCW